MVDFSPWDGLAGGALIGLGAVVLMVTNGRIMGMSGILSAAFEMPPSRGTLWRLAFLLGMAVSALSAAALGYQPEGTGLSIGPLMASGALVGFGARMANGCTSGHGICGLARFSVRSLWAVTTFVAVAIIVVLITRHVIGG